MSEQEEITLFENIRKGVHETQRRLFERKAKLGENVVVADLDGMPMIISAEEALKRLKDRIKDKE